MKIYTFSVLLLIISNFCCAEELIHEYHFNSVHIHRLNGCEHVHNNNTVVTRFATVGKKNKQKRDMVPLSEPFEVNYKCDTGTKKQCKILKNSVKYIQDLFSSLFDFYTPIKIDFIISEKDDPEYIAYTEQPIYYPLKNPNEREAYSYPAPLAKQLNTNIPIDFDKNREHDIAITFSKHYLGDDINIVPTIVHELLHGFGFCAQLKIVHRGVIGNDLPAFGGDYYMPELLSIDNRVEGKRTIKGFLPISIYEKNFVDIDNPNSYYFDESFDNLSSVKINYDLHNPPYIVEKENIKKFTGDMEKWNGMETGIHFYERSHTEKSVAFRTNDGTLLYLCTYANSDDPDFNHLATPNFTYNSPDSVENQEVIDHNFILYRNNVGLNLSNEEKIKKFGKGKTVGLLSKDIISALETMGYHRKGSPPDNTVYEVVSQIVRNSKTYIKGEDVSNDDDTIVGGEEGSKNDEKSGTPNNSTQSLVYIFLLALCSIFMLH